MSEDPLALSKFSAAPPALADYDQIVAAVMETERGRWFLTEYARRNRHADTHVILGAIERIEAAFRGEAVPPNTSHLRLDLIDMAEVIARTKAEMAAIKPEAAGGGKGEAGSARHDRATGAQPSTGLLAAAERILDIVWTLREREADFALCDALHAAASEILAAGESQDLALLQADKAMQVVHHLEGRINALIDAWGDGAPKAATDVAQVEAAAEHSAEPASETQMRAEEEEEAPFGQWVVPDLDPLMPVAPLHESEAVAEAHTLEPEPQPEPIPAPAAEIEPGPVPQTYGESAPAVPQVGEEANLLDQAIALIASAPDRADAGVAAMAGDAESELPEAAPSMLNAASEGATAADEPERQPEPELAMAADATAIVLAMEMPAAFTVVGTPEIDLAGWALNAPAASPPVPEPEEGPQIEASSTAANMDSASVPGPADAVAEVLDAPVPVTETDEPAAQLPKTEAAVASFGPAEIYAPASESEPGPQRDVPADDSPAAIPESDVLAERATAPTADEPGAAVAARASDEAALASAALSPAEPVRDGFEVSPAVELSAEPAAPERASPTPPEPAPAVDSNDLGHDVSAAPPPVIAPAAIAAELPPEESAQPAAAAPAEYGATRPAAEFEPATHPADVAAEPATEMAIVQADFAGEAGEPVMPPVESAGELPCGKTDPAARPAADDIEFLLEPLPGPAPLPPEAVADLAEPDEDLAELFESLPAPTAEPTAEPSAEPSAEASAGPSPESSAETSAEPSEKEGARQSFEPHPAIHPPLGSTPDTAATAEVLTPPSDAALDRPCLETPASIETSMQSATVTDAAIEPVTTATTTAPAAPQPPPEPSAAVAAPAAGPQRVAPSPILTPRATPADSMAAVRALSEDELIALFS